MKTDNLFFNFANLFLTMVVIGLCFGSAFAQSEAEKQGREIFEKYLAALGGKDNLDKIKTVETISESSGATGHKKLLDIQDKPNKKYYTSSEDDRGKTEMGSNGSQHWMRRGGRADYVNFTPVEETVKYVKLPNETRDGKEYLVVEEVKPNPRGNNKTFYDPDTFLLAYRERMAGVGGETFKILTIYSDYRKVGDILVPFIQISNNSVSGQTTRKILSVRHNIEVDAQIFELDGPSPKREEKTAGNQSRD